jgi:hypothetical protein
MGHSLVSVGLDGSDLVALIDLTTSVHPSPPGVGPVMSADQELMAFRGNDDGMGGIWVVSSDRTGLHQLTSLSGLLSWPADP